jgi:DNA-binding SARP family transcriptional activator
MEFELLGPPTMRKNGRTVNGRGPMHQLVLAIMLTEPRFISTEELIDLTWPPDDPDVTVPRDPRARLYEIISDLRRALRDAGEDADGLLPQRRNGYHAQVRRDQIDLLRFHDRRGAARASRHAGDLERAVQQYRKAFSEWRAEAGPSTVEPYAGLTGRWVRNQRERLRSVYLTDLVACIDLELQLGQHRRLVPELVALNAARPLDEQIARLLMLAQYGSEQPAEALGTYTRIHKRLTEDLGNEPGEMLQELHRKILRQDPALLVPGEPTPPFQKGQIVTEHYTNQMDGIALGPFAQIGKVAGNFSFGTPTPEAAPMAEAVHHFRRSVHAARQAGDLPAATAAAVDGELARVLCGGDDMAAAMDDIRRLVDGAPDLVKEIDEMIDLARRESR